MSNTQHIHASVLACGSRLRSKIMTSHKNLFQQICRCTGAELYSISGFDTRVQAFPSVSGRFVPAVSVSTAPMKSESERIWQWSGKSLLVFDDVIVNYEIIYSLESHWKFLSTLFPELS